ncbi:ACP S-malonyltransferase [Campylobacter sp. LR196d]|nr:MULTISPECIES: ACP S-malonyltransferase [unclassified Campylobacter]KAA6224626.1 ACP S-malonyltransferase [Campylobacter sp. LR185c]KAA6224868.1 ACP S-malonyltransferase [Campylobacter sp. LR286c]KAA6228015.1 ACP S-malonyltransferase [Campylobacter sp. LR196d]KAA8603572.1 malonyl CoA-acyl carrier protein transacylase [Campylobacter sp. LR185c]
MGQSFYENCNGAKNLLEEASDYCKIDFKNLLFSENDELNKSEFTQPAIVLSSLMAYVVLKEKLNLTPSFCLGHSLGEFSALAVSGAFSYLDAILLVHKRGLFMQEDCSKIKASMMVILGLDDEMVENLCKNAQEKNKQIYVANYNCDGQIVIAGLRPDLEEFEDEFRKAGAKKTMLLNMSVASHCPLLQNASLKLGLELDKILNASFNPVVSNVNAKIYTDKINALNLLKNQLVKPVLYKQSIKNIENEVDCFVEFSTNILKGLNKKITQKETFTLLNINDIDEFVEKIK